MCSNIFFKEERSWVVLFHTPTFQFRFFVHFVHAFILVNVTSTVLWHAGYQLLAQSLMAIHSCCSIAGSWWQFVGSCLSTCHLHPGSRFLIGLRSGDRIQSVNLLISVQLNYHIWFLMWCFIIQKTFRAFGRSWSLRTFLVSSINFLLYKLW